MRADAGQALPGGFASPARIHASSEGHDPRTLEPGVDLVLHAPGHHGTALPHGVLIDDGLGPDERAGIDHDAITALARWRSRRDGALTHDGVCLPWLHEGELLTDVFLREHRVFAGVEAALAQGPPARVELHGIDRALASALREFLERIGVAEVASVSEGPAPLYPIEFVRAARRRRSGVVRQALGLPGRVRGSVLVKPYWHLAPLWGHLLAEPGWEPVVDPFDPPALPPRQLGRVLARGGWIGHPGARARMRSRAAVARLVESLRAPGAEAQPIERLLELRAKAFLSQRATDTPAQVELLRSAFSAGKIRAAVLPSDGTPAGRAIAIAGRETGVRTVHVQHGFFGDLWRVDGELASNVDGLVADRVGAWSERHARALAPQAAGEVSVTGNPGAAALARGAWLPSRSPREGLVLVLVQPPFGATAAIDVRTSRRHAHAALTGLVATRGVSRAVLRPHPLDPYGYDDLATTFPGLELSVERSVSIEAALSEARACVGPLSTATLQAAAAGIPTVFLSAFERPLPWPFDGSGAFPTARTPVELTALLGEVMAAVDPPGREAAAEALGLRKDALERVMELVTSP